MTLEDPAPSRSRLASLPDAECLLPGFRVAFCQALDVSDGFGSQDGVELSQCQQKHLFFFVGRYDSPGLGGYVHQTLDGYVKCLGKPLQKHRSAAT